MSQPYDATTKFLLEFQPQDWLACAGLHTTARVRAVDADLSTVTTDADMVFLVEEQEPWMAHFELQGQNEKLLSLRVARYNVLIEYQFETPVISVLVLLRPEADGPGLTGVFRRSLPSGELYDEFRFRIIRVWQLPVETLLDGGLATLPLAPLANVSEKELPEVIRRMGERIEAEAPADEGKTLWTAAFVLMGLRYSEETVQKLILGVRGMKESVTYQAILREGRALGVAEGKAEGRAEEARRLLLRLGRRKFGPANPSIVEQVDSLHNVDHLEDLAERIQDASSWDELLGQE